MSPPHGLEAKAKQSQHHKIVSSLINQLIEEQAGKTSPAKMTQVITFLNNTDKPNHELNTIVESNRLLRNGSQ